MKIDKNDPRWTAYALGETKDEKERAELEQILQESEEIRQMVEEIRRTADLLNDGLKYDLPDGLTEAQRDRIESQGTIRTSWIWSRPVWALSGAAVMIILALSVWMIQSRYSGKGPAVAPTLMQELRTEDTPPVPETATVAPVAPEAGKMEPAAETDLPVESLAEPAKKTRASLTKAADAGISKPARTETGRKVPNVELAATSVTVVGSPEVTEVENREDAPVEAPVLAADKKPESKLPLTTDAATEAFAQSVKPAIRDTSISGLVMDESGGILPGATLIATKVDTGISDTILTNDAGQYEFSNLDPGEYQLSAEMDGFQKKTYTNIQLAEAITRRLDLSLPVAGLEQEVLVSVETENILLESNPSAGVAAGDGGALGSRYAGGVSPSMVNVQRDGVTVSDVRHQEGMPSPVRLNPEIVGKLNLVTTPVDAEMARRRYPMPPPPPKPVPPRWPGERRMPPIPGEKFNTESYENIVDNPFMETTQNPLSTFSIDVDTASYSNIRRFLEDSQLPPKDAIRIEELVNYFDYDYKGPDREDPFAARFEMTEAPWNAEHKLLRIGLKALEMDKEERPATNLVFLIDVSGSMSSYNKLPLVKDSLHMLVDRLTETDHVAIVTYAGSTRVALPSTRGDQKWSIHRAIDYLRSGGSTAGASGIQLAYETARKNFINGGANRIILATDGDFNVGITSHGELTRLIEEKAESGVFLTALGFGMGNYKDDTLELLADKGRGNYAYIDTIEEAKKVLVEQINATLVSVAKDVKIQVEFNPGRVGAYRLIGYEDRVMPKEDFNDDTKKAGVIGAGHAVTALYEIVPAGKPIPSSGVDPLKYQKPVETTRDASGDEVATVKIRYKKPEGEESRLLVFPVKDSDRKFGKASKDFRFAASVAAFGMVLRDSPYKGSSTLEDALDWAKDGKGEDRYGYRAEFIRLLHRAISIKK